MKALLKFLSPLVFCSLIQAEEITIATEAWEGYINKQEEGFYYDLLKKIYPSPEYTLTVHFVPFKRSVHLLTSGQVDMLLGAYPEDIPRKYQSTHPVEADNISAAVSKRLSEKWRGTNSLAGKRVVARLGYNFDKYLPKTSSYTEVPSVKSMLLMLKRGRTDAVLDYEKDIQALWKDSQLGDDYVLITGVIPELVYFGFATSRNDLKARFDAEYKKLYQSGKLKKLFLKHNLCADRVPKIDY
ncbi:substrate-binding periplasmic protein [Rubritalea spongiae]|uniref:Substrate-binding periplasmic protein n=1 Tax=Rubritalea spongiae TaxID=430797 RepID=A0ABW5E3F7_9BACT